MSALAGSRIKQRQADPVSETGCQTLSMYCLIIASRVSQVSGALHLAFGLVAQAA